MSDPLADEVRRFREQTARAAQQRRLDARYSRTARAREDIRYSARFFYQFWKGLCWLWAWIGQPVTRWLWQFKDAVFRSYKILWAYVVYRRTRDDVLVFSKTRAAVMIVVTACTIWFAVLPTLKMVFLDLPAYALTANVNEKLYLWNPQEIDSETNSQLIRGCAKTQCTQEETEYFRVENGLFENLWSLVNHGNLFFPEFVASVPGTATPCVITSYWFRFRLTSRFFNIYPHLLSTSCDYHQKV